MTVSTEVYEAFRSINVPEDKAIRAAEALSGHDGGTREAVQRIDVRLTRVWSG